MSFPPETKRTPSRFRNPLGKYKIHRTAACVHCGLCAELCPTGVHRRLGKKMLPPLDERCIGPSCKKNEFCCIARCPKGALRLALNPSLQALRDYRWPADLLLATWQQAETGSLPWTDLEYRVGNSGGGFDRLRLRLPKVEKGRRPAAGAPPGISPQLLQRYGNRYGARPSAPQAVAPPQPAKTNEIRYVVNSVQGSWEHEGDKYQIKAQDDKGKAGTLQATADAERLVVQMPNVTLVFAKAD